MTKWLMTLVVRSSITFMVSGLALGGYWLCGNPEQDFEKLTKGVSLRDLVTGKQWKEFHAAGGFKFDSNKEVKFPEGRDLLKNLTEPVRLPQQARISRPSDGAKPKQGDRRIVETAPPTPSNVCRKVEILREVARDWWTTPRAAVSDNAARQKELRRQFDEVTKRLDDAQPQKRDHRVGAR
jgi:hypothetical protein